MSIPKHQNQKQPKADAETVANSLGFLTESLLAYSADQAELQDSIYVHGQWSKYLVAKFIQNNLFDCWGLYFYLQQEASRN